MARKKITVSDLVGDRSRLSRQDHFRELARLKSGDVTEKVTEEIRADSVKNTEKIRKVPVENAEKLRRKHGRNTEKLRKNYGENQENLRKINGKTTETAAEYLRDLVRLKYGYTEGGQAEITKQTVNIPRTKYEKLKQYCKGAGISFQHLVNKLIDFFLEAI